MSEYEELTLEDGQFLPLAGLLLAIFVLAALGAGVLLVLRGDSGDQQAFSSTSTAVYIANATTLAQNAQVTATLLALTEEAARPTETSTSTPVPPTATPPPTVVPTDTPEPADTEATAEAEATGVLEVSPDDATATAEAVIGGGGGEGDAGGTLPDTGVGAAGILAAAFGLLLVVGLARRLRAVA